MATRKFLIELYSDLVIAFPCNMDYDASLVIKVRVIIEHANDSNLIAKLEPTEFHAHLLS